jgi:hypothetical protein
VLEPGDPSLTTFEIEGVAFRVARPYLKAIRYVAEFLHELEPVTLPGWDGAYAHRKVAGTDVWSEHSAGTTFDWNASRHPQGTTRYAGWDATRVRMIRWLLRQPVGLQFRWGADFTTTPDPMHFELRSKTLWDATDGWWKR